MPRVLRTKEMNDEWPYVWYWRTRLPERKGQPCRVLVRAKRMNSILVEFPDGHTVVTSRYAVRSRKKEG